MWTCNICNKTVQKPGGHPRAHNPNYAPWNKGLTKADPRVAKCGLSVSAALKGRHVSEECKRKLSAALSGRRQTEAHKKAVVAARQSYINDPEARRAAAELTRKNWADGKMQGALEKMLKRNETSGFQKSITGPERFFISLCKSENLPYNYTGFGETRKTVGTMVPDFMHKSDRKIIEIFGDYWHRNDDPNNRIKRFENLGYKCLVFWEYELYKNLDSVLDRVKEFSK